MTTPTIETERLTLRPFRDDDLDAHFALLDIPEVRASLPIPDEWAFATHDVDELVSCILAANTASQAVARRLGFTLREEKVLASFPSTAHQIWVLPRPS